MAATLDTFNRANNAATLGNADTGELWTPASTSVWGISGNMAYCPTLGSVSCWPGPGGHVTIDRGQADHAVECDVSVAAANAVATGIIGRWSTIGNLWMAFVMKTAGTPLLYAGKVVAEAGSYVLVNAGALAGAGPWRLRLEFIGNQVSVYVDGVLKGNVADNFNNTATKVGLLAGNAGAAGVVAFDNFYANLAQAPKSYVNEVLKDSPVGYWRLNEKAGVNAADLSGNGFTGTYTAGPTLGVASPIKTDPNASGITVNGATQYVFLPASLILETFAPMSIEIWVKTTMSAGSGTIFASQDTNNHGWNLDVGVFSSGHLAFWDHTAWRTGPLINDGLWHHVVATNDGANVRFYVDGVLASTVAAVSPDQMGFRDNHAIGALADHAFNGGPLQTNNFFAGSLTECALYSKVLSAGAVATHYDAAFFRSGWGLPI